MKNLLMSAIATTLLFTACRKGSSNETILSDYWKVGAYTYTVRVTISDRSTDHNTISANTGDTGSNNSGSISFYFLGSSIPTPGSYRVVRGTPVAAGEVAFNTQYGPSGSLVYYSGTGNDKVFATVSVSDNTVRVQMPNAWGVNKYNPADTVQVSADIDHYL